MAAEPLIAVDSLLQELDHIAREHDVYEYGLPLHSPEDEDAPIHKLRAAVVEWLNTYGVKGEGNG
jgi:hypothetical protein